MKNYKKILRLFINGKANVFVAFVIICQFGVYTSAAQEVTGQIEASVRLRAPLAITELSDMKLGAWEIKAQGFKVYLNPSNNNHEFSSAISISKEAVQRAVFQVTGYEGANYVISKSPVVYLVRDGGNEVFELIPELYSLNSGSGNYGVILRGTDNLFVGGTVRIPGSAINPAGTYNGTYAITLTYQ